LKTIDELREQLKAAAVELSGAKDEAMRAEARVTAETAEARRLKVQLEELREDAQSARRVTEAVQAELRAKAERLLKAETSEKLLQERSARAEAAAAKVAVSTKELEDLNRRREAFLTTILRRFREVNDLYRNFTLAAQTRDTPATGLQAGDLSRIQTTIQQAEDDLRQLQTLNARVAQLARATK
jgi:chromosome segregation ATPase